MDRNDHIKYNLQCYLPYIRECVDAKHLLQHHLVYYASDESDELSKLARTNPGEATKKAFDILMQKDQPGVFTALLQSFEDEYPKIVKLLKGDVVKCDANYRHIVTVFTPEIIKQIHPIELLVHLRRYDVITEEEAEETRAEMTNHGPTTAVWFIVTNIHRHIEDWFKYFIVALIDAGSEYLANTLDRDMVEKVKAQREFATANEDLNEEQFNNVREHVQEETHDLQSLQLENVPESVLDANMTAIKTGITEHNDDNIEDRETVIARNLQKELTDANMLNIRQDQDEITAIKQVFRQNDEEKEEIEDTDDDSEFIYDRADFNDLDRLSPETDDIGEDAARKIATDVDEITNIEEHNIGLRGYQKKLAQKGIEGENVIIMAPTNSGKTKVACQIVHSVFKRFEQQGKAGTAAFIVDKEELAFQQGKVFEEELPGFRTKVITGDVQQSKNQHLKEYVHRRDVLVITAQVLLNCLKAKAITTLGVFDIIVFDECHHTDKNHPYKNIMDYYFEQKLTNVDLPQIVGLTASIGVGGNLDRNVAFQNMKQIAANLNAMVLCTVDDDEAKAEMKTYINDPDEEVVTVPRRTTERFYKDILDTIENIDKFMAKNTNVETLAGDDSFMKTISRVPTISAGTPQFQSWLSDFRKGLSVLSSDQARQILNPCWCYLEQYHLAIMIYNDARVKDSLNSLQEFVDGRRKADFNNEADQFLLQLFDDLRSKLYTDVQENPKLLKLKELVLRTVGRQENARGIVFVRTKALANILKKWMHRTDTLKELNARVFIGQDIGMTKRKQRDVLALFKNGRHKIIIATTVAEEGLDIAKCNLVIKYEHVTDERARVQCRGRARAENSKYYVVTEEGSNISEKEEFNARCEKLMEELVPELKSHMEQDMNRWIDEILQMQRNAKKIRQDQNRLRQENMKHDFVNLHCGNCGTLICSSEDIKKVCGMHHIVVNPGIREKVVLEQSQEPKHKDAKKNMKLGGYVFCSNKICIYKHRLGGILQFKDFDFPALSVKSVCIKTLTGEPLPSARQWSKVIFQVESIDIANLTMIVRENLLV